MKFRVLYGLLCVLLVASLALMACAAPTGPIELKYSQHSPATNWWYDEVNEEWIKRVTERSEGTLNIIGYPGATLAKQPEIWEAVKGGVTDIGLTYVASNPGMFPLLEVTELPGINMNSAEVSIRVKWETYKKFRPEELEDVHLSKMCSSPPLMFLSQAPIHSLDDIKGLQVGLSGKIHAECVSAVGGVPVNVLPQDFYMSLEKGMVQAVLTAPEVLRSYKIAEVTSAIAPFPGGASVTFLYILNKDVWDSLPDKAKKAFDDEVEFAVSEEARIEAGWQIKGVEYALETNPDYEVCQLTDTEAWVELLQPVAAAKVAEVDGMGLPGTEVYEYMQEVADKYNAQYPPYRPAG